MSSTSHDEIELYFKGTILPKSISSDPLIDLENGFVLTDERKENIKTFSSKEIYDAIKKQNPELLKALPNIEVENYKKEEFTNYLKEDGIKVVQDDKIEVPKIENQIIHTIFESFKISLKTLFEKDSKLYVSKTKIDTKDECCLGWFKSNIYELYVFSDLESSTFIEYYLSKEVSTPKEKIEQSVIDTYKKLFYQWKLEYLRNLRSKIEIGVSKINSKILDRHFLKYPKYYLLELDIEDKNLGMQKLNFYITLRKAKNVQP